MTTAEQRFVRELDILRVECEASSQLLYAYLGIHSYARRRPSVARMLDARALFWNTTLYGLQASALITLGRVFDQDTPHNVDVLLGMAQRDPSMFAKAALRRRKREAVGSSTPWLDEYMANAYEPTVADFRHLRKHVAKARRVYDARYRDLRNRVFAHRVALDDEVAPIAAKANVYEFKRLIAALLSLHQALWDLFWNGRAPTLRKRRFAAKPPKEEETAGPHERIVAEAEAVLRDLMRQRRPSPRSRAS